jgi:hypothetical protein
MLELRPAAQRQYIDAVAVFTAHEDARKAAAQVRGGMYWKNTGYLIRTSPSGGEKSLGPRSPETEKMFARFTERKAESAARLSGLQASLNDHQRLNRALRVGRVDPLITRLLARLDATALSEHFRVVGTHALYAYEAEAGVVFDPDTVATRDIDLLWDVTRRVQFATALQRVDTSMLGVLKKVDASFRIRASQKYTAVNQDGFEVDIIRRAPVDGEAHPVQLSADVDDFWVAQAPNAHVLLDSPPFSAVIVASSGEMARMHTLHPLAFAKFKRWMARLPGRDPRKRRRDELQAKAVEAVVAKYLPQHQRDFVVPEIPAVPRHLTKALHDAAAQPGGPRTR